MKELTGPPEQEIDFYEPEDKETKTILKRMELQTYFNQRATAKAITPEMRKSLHK